MSGTPRYAERVAVIGLDCADPVLLFDRWVDRLPNIRELMNAGTYGPLISCTPPITVPAWSCMTSSQDPGMLGIYGFRNRRDYSYAPMSIASALDVAAPRLWDILSESGRHSIVVGVPGTYPIRRPPRGCMITGPLTPGIHSPYTAPPQLKDDIAQWVGCYLVDVQDFRTASRPDLLQQITRMTTQRFEIVERLMRRQHWDLMWMVEIGLDRMHHAFWRFMDPHHPGHEPGHLLQHAIRDYTVHLDHLIGRVLQGLDLRTTAVWVVSDHGVQRAEEGFCLNQWLCDHGYLALRHRPRTIAALTAESIDWTATRAWGEGGYYGRVFLNVRGREPQGAVAPENYEALCGELAQRLRHLPACAGRPVETTLYRPQDLYRQTRGVPPDLMVVIDDYRRRSISTIGHDGYYTRSTAIGHDDANHTRQGAYLFRAPGVASGGLQQGATLYDVAPTILQMLGQKVPDGMIGRGLL